MCLTIIIPCSTADADYFFEWFAPFVHDDRFDFRYLIVLNGDFVPQCYQELNLESVTIVTITRPLFPGQARNIALDYIDDGHLVFIDARTIVTSNWLKFAYDFHLNHPSSSCLGSVVFVPSKSWHLPLISSTYGFNQITCLPGSIIHRKAFSRAGFFLPNVRAGEDIDWIWRASCHSLFLDIGVSPPLKYNLDPGKDFFYYLRKWFRNYSYTSTLPYISDSQRAFYAFFLFVTVSCFAYAWNSLFANWNEQSPLYIPFVSRFVVSLFVFSYLFLRCICLPLKKGASIKNLAISFPLLVPISIALDGVKLMAFLPLIFRMSRASRK